MAQGDKDKYTDKQRRQADHIRKGYLDDGLTEEEAEERAWATVNKIHGGGNNPSGGGRGKSESHQPMRKGGKNNGADQ